MNNVVGAAIRRSKFIPILTLFKFNTPASATPSVNVTNIQAVLDLAEASGGDVVFTRNDDYEIDANLEMGNNTWLHLENATIVPSASIADGRFITNKGRPAGQHNGAGGGNSNIWLEGGTIDSSLTSTVASRTVGFYNVDNLEIIGTKVINTDVHGFHIEDCSGAKIHSNTSVVGCGDDAYTFIRCIASYLEDFTASGGTSVAGGSHGVEVEDRNKGIVVRRGKITDFQDFGGKLGGGILIDSNNVQALNENILIEDIEIGNTAFNGITFNTDAAVSPSNNITARRINLVSAGKTGAVRVERANNVTLEDITIDGNSAAGSRGIQIANSTGIKFSASKYGRTVINNSFAQAIYVYSDTCKDITIGNVEINNPCQTVSFSEAVRIKSSVAESKRLTLQNINITDDGVGGMTKGINIDATADGWKLADNDVVGTNVSAANAYIYTAGTNTTISNNTGGEAGDL